MSRNGLASRVYGVGFSGSPEEAGRRTWVAGGDLVDGRFHVEECRPAVDRFGVSPTLDRTLSALTSWLAARDSECAVGLDFPFGLPATVVSEQTWEGFVFRFPDWFDSPTDLSRRCRARASLTGEGEDDPRRATERAVSALPAYSRRLAPRTFHGIRDVLRPLVLADAVRVTPMAEPTLSHPLLLEVYPAATLENLETAVDASVHWNDYEGATETGRRRRRENVDALEGQDVEVADDVRERVVDDETGCGLESVVAAFAAYRNVTSENNLQTSDEQLTLEGYIHV